MKIQVLDHGYVELIEPWGAGRDGNCRMSVEGKFDTDYEVGIVEAARQSTQGNFRGWEPADCTCGLDDTYGGKHLENCARAQNPGDKKLLHHLYTNNHSTPFEFAGMVIEVQAPIFVFREWQRHRTQSYNEMSARYAPLPDLYYMPMEAALLERAEKARFTKNKQASATATLDSVEIEHWRQWATKLQSECEDAYRFALDNGVPKELARLTMPVSHYSRMRAATNLRNWLAFMTLRCDPSAQWEIQQFAWAVAEIINAKFPHTYKLWSEANWS